MAILSGSQNEQCRLLTLPGEIRNRIYHHIFSIPDRKVTIRKTKPKSAPLVLAVLQTSRQIYEESSCIFYHINHLRFYAKNLTAFQRSKKQSLLLNSLGETRLSAIRSLTISLTEGAEFEIIVCHKLKHFPSLETLELELVPSALVLDQIVSEDVCVINHLHTLIVRSLPKLKAIRILASSDSPHLQYYEELGVGLQRTISDRAGAMLPGHEDASVDAPVVAMRDSCIIDIPRATTQRNVSKVSTRVARRQRGRQVDFGMAALGI
ncbi:hypothetical protein LTR37_011306 [Vermiconidia calcicola]|uniref:Uncharacterized protein n=1 Tax=Vermiconidia calcicola TaxID=1690605 RepID=A0ACC3N2V8_9PEZI|nr:hypothetical protein LTR37_011306 [Vermiconidia calcicola]